MPTILSEEYATTTGAAKRKWIFLPELKPLVHILRILLLCGVVAASASSNMPAHAQAPDQLPAKSTGQGAAAVPAAAVSGTIVDTNDDVIEGARVQLSKAGSPGILREMNSGSMGEFAFGDLEPGTYLITVSRNGMMTFASKPIVLRSGTPVTLPKVVLSIAAATTTVRVMDPAAASIEQVEVAEQQRVLKIFPNFYSSYDWDAAPMLPKQKYRLAARTLIDPVTFLTTGAIAGAEQYENIFPSFGGGLDGYAKRYGAAYATHASGELLIRAVFPSIFHTDPRYFIKGTGSSRARAEHAIASTFVTRGDDAKRRVNFPEILGAFSAAALSNAYFPANERGANLVLVNGFGDLGGDILDNLLREFVLNRLTTRAKH
jgi:Carboxypeptidase regulatory-like domain